MTNGATIIKKAEAILESGNNRRDINGFLERYSKCEVLTRPVVRDYYKNINESCPDEDLLKTLQVIKDALLDGGYIFDEKKLLTRIWGKSEKPQESSCRYLRNKIVHELMPRAMREVVNRKEELYSDLDRYINILK